MALLMADTALLSWCSWALSATVADLTAIVASASKLTLDAWIWAIGLVVTNLSAAESIC